MAARGSFNINVYGQIKNKRDQDYVIKNLQENVKLLDVNSRSDSTIFGGMMLVMGFSGVLKGLGSFNYWLTRFRSKLKQYFNTADFEFFMTYEESEGV